MTDQPTTGAGRRDPPSGFRVSIGLPVFNGERYVAAAIDAMLAQSFRDFELIICDNASTDRTREICESRAKRDPRIRYIRSDTNIGGAANFNRVFDLAGGEYFKWAAHDDVVAPDWLAQCIDVLDRDPSAVLCQSAVSTIAEDGRILADLDSGMPDNASPSPGRRFADLVLVDHPCTLIFGLIRSDALRKTPRIAPYVASDRVLLAELGLLGRFREVPGRLFLLREHPERSVTAIPFHKRAAWFDPAAGSRRVFPHWRFYTEYFVCVHRVCRRRRERWACYAHLCRWPWKNMNWARLASDLVIAAWPGSGEKLMALNRRQAARTR
jgi:glycosyltransferase involved in cell wall biosynthesis